MVSVSLLFLVALSGTYGQASERAASSTVQVRGPVEEAGSREEERASLRLFLAKAREAEYRVQAFRSRPERILALSGLAGVVCPVDPDLSRAWFEQAYRSLAEEAESADLEDKQTVGSPKQPVGESSRRVRVEGLRYILRTRASSCDRNLALALEPRSGDSRSASRSRFFAGVAAEAVRQGSFDALALVQKAIDEVQPETVGTIVKSLNRLAMSDPTAAGNAFTDLVGSLRGTPLSVSNLQELGLFLFTSFRQLDGGPSGSSFARVGGVYTMIQVANKRSISPAAAAVYLDFATSVLLSKAVQGEQPGEVYVAAFQLAPKVQEFLPSRSADITQVCQLTRSKLPAAAQSEDAFSILGASPAPSVQDKNIDSLSTSSERDARRTSLVDSILRTGQVDTAAAVAAKISDPDLKSALLRMVTLALGDKLLKEHRCQDAEQVTGRLPAGVERSLLFLGAAACHAADPTSREAALQDVAAALLDTAAVDEELRPILMLGAADVHSRLDPEGALRTFLQGVSALNGLHATRSSGSGGEPPERRFPAQGVNYPVANVGKVTFPIRVSGVVLFELRPLVERLAQTHSDDVEQIVGAIQSEEVLGQVLPALLQAARLLLPKGSAVGADVRPKAPS